MTSKIKQRIEQIQRGEVPEGYKKTKVGIVPSEWIYEKLDNYLIPHHEVSEYSNQYPVLTSSRKGIFLQSDYYTREVASEDNTGYNVVPRGYFTYRHMSDDEIFKFNINNIVDRGIVSTLYPVFTTRNINDYFLQTALNEGREFRRYAILQKQGGSRTYMYYDKLKQLKVCLPPLTEQEKIAEILSAQDKLIGLKEKLIEEKKKQKKALMQQLLTGKTRLPGFNNEWKDVLFKDCIAEIDERSTESNQYPILSVTKDGIVYQSEHFNKQIASDNNIGYKIVKRNQLAFSILNLWMGSVDVLSLCDIGIVSPAYKVFECVENILTPNFAKYFLRSYNVVWLYNVNSYTGASVVRKNLDLVSLLNEKFKLPSIKEQLAIANILVVADNEIELLKKELEQEKQKKKALMQLLLTGIVRVN